MVDLEESHTTAQLRAARSPMKMVPSPRAQTTAENPASHDAANQAVAPWTTETSTWSNRSRPQIAPFWIGLRILAAQRPLVTTDLRNRGGRPWIPTLRCVDDGYLTGKLVLVDGVVRFSLAERVLHR